MKRMESTLRVVCTVTAAIAFGAAVAADTDTPVLNVGGTNNPGGTVKGAVKFEGRQAKRKRIKMDADTFCKGCHANEPALMERYIFGENDTLQNVFVYVSKGLDGKSFSTPTEKSIIDQRGCVYIPHVSGVMVDQTIEIHNSDMTLHNVKMTSDNNDTFNQGMVQGVALTKTLSSPEMGVRFKCDVHPWMSAYVHVLSHPFFAVTQADGTFTIKGLPPGDYELSVWHEFDKFAPVEKTIKVSVAEGETKEVTFTYKPPKKKKKK